MKKKFPAGAGGQELRVSQAKGWRNKGMFAQINELIKVIDDAVWGLPLICLIMVTGILLTVRLGGVQVRHLGKAFKFMFQDEEDGHGEVTSFGALCTALSATIGTGKYRRCCDCDRSRWPGSIILDGCCRIFRNGDKVFRRSSCNQIPHDRSRRSCSGWTFLLY